MEPPGEALNTDAENRRAEAFRLSHGNGRREAGAMDWERHSRDRTTGYNRARNREKGTPKLGQENDEDSFGLTKGGPTTSATGIDERTRTTTTTGNGFGLATTMGQGRTKTARPESARVPRPGLSEQEGSGGATGWRRRTAKPRVAGKETTSRYRGRRRRDDRRSGAAARAAGGGAVAATPLVAGVGALPVVSVRNGGDAGGEEAAATPREVVARPAGALTRRHRRLEAAGAGEREGGGGEERCGHGRVREEGETEGGEEGGSRFIRKEGEPAMGEGRTATGFGAGGRSG
uniref:Uncharacterized protein n=1 Tax=Oryza punctata TaxID=4537 RepID=A0A0E0LAM3_ORYPU